METAQAQFSTASEQPAQRSAVAGYETPVDVKTATRLSSGGVADHFVTLMLRQGDAGVFKRYSQLKLSIMREVLTKLDPSANERPVNYGATKPN